MTEDLSTFLFARPSFMTGVARTLDIGATFDAWNESATPELADQRALRADFLAAANEFRQVVEAKAAAHANA